MSQANLISDDPDHSIVASSDKIEKGSRILVTGGGGYVGSAIVHQSLVEGFKVRATTRDISKLEELKKQVDQHFGVGRLEVVEVKDLSIENALEKALEDCAGVIHVASDTSGSSDVHATVKTVVAMTESVLQSCKAAQSVKSVVFTSSRIAVCNPRGDADYREYGSEDWNDEAFGLAETEQIPELVPLHVYAASKVAGERAFWSFIKREKPNFRANTVNPDVVFGKIHNPGPGFFSTASLLQMYARGEPGVLEVFLLYITYFVEVEDTARLHVAALLDESVSNQRIIAAAEPYSASQIEEALKAINPEYKGRDTSAFPKRANLKIDNKPSIKLLQKRYGKGYTDLKAAVRANECFKA